MKLYFNFEWELDAESHEMQTIIETGFMLYFIALEFSIEDDDITSAIENKCKYLVDYSENELKHGDQYELGELIEYYERNSYPVEVIGMKK